MKKILVLAYKARLGEMELEMLIFWRKSRLLGFGKLDFSKGS